MLAWKIRLPSLEKLFSCGLSPDGNVPTLRPVAVSRTSTTLAVGEARPRDVEQAAVARGVGVVDPLVVALADLLADGQEVAEPYRVHLDLGHPLRLVRDRV